MSVRELFKAVFKAVADQFEQLADFVTKLFKSSISSSSNLQ